ncbi:hypothetical protein Mapa_007338 [Marchantia paleacea]|nr:hypothetical protein Mapa_007338 [Marchantia paleacea]
MKLITLYRLDTVVLLFILIMKSHLRLSHADKNETSYTTHPTGMLSPTPVPTPMFPTNAEFDQVPDRPVVLDYHMGPIMTGRDDVLKLYVIYYGSFTTKQKSTLQLFFNSLRQGVKPTQVSSFPTVLKWWQLTREYSDLYGDGVARQVVLAGERAIPSAGNLTQLDIQQIVKDSTVKFGKSARAMYLVLTDEDVTVERFCMNVCGTHFYTYPSDETESQMLPYGWVGNPKKQCPSLCSWPYAPGGVQNISLISPNGDAGIDGMIITIATILANVVTNPFGTGYYQPDGLEAASVCQGIYGTGAFPGSPGKLLVDNSSGASFNVFGEKNAKFLLPWIWQPSRLQCAGQE